MTEESSESVRSLGRYSLVHTLGQGGMGEVYLAKITGAAGFEKPCIVKTILPSLLSDRQFLDRFHHEAKVLVHLVHSNIAQVYDMGEENGSYFMALEYVAGVDLSQLMEAVRKQGSHIPIPIALYIGARIAEGLGYAHRKTAPDGTPLGIVHRDVSPHNVMVGYEGEVKVIDFGLARSAARSRYTLPATVMGKLGYMSPEQARAEPLDHRTDIYSCGLVMWEMLAGRSAFNAGTIGEMMAAMANPQLPPLRELRPEIDPALEAVVAQALAPDPALRYTRADEFSRKLSEQLLRTGSSIGAEEVGQYVRTACPEAFAEQRKLISRLSTVSTLKRTPIPLNEMSSPPVPSTPPGSDADGFAATHVASLTSAEAAAVKGSRVPWIVAGVSLALLLCGGGVLAWRLMQERASTNAPTPAPSPAATATALAPPAAEPPSPAPAPAPAEAPTAPTTAAEPAPAAHEEKSAANDERATEVEAASAHRRTAADVELVEDVTVRPLIVDHSGTYIRAGAVDGLTEGTVLKVVGKPKEGGKRRVFGTATVLAVKPNLSRVALDHAAKRARGAKFVALPSAPVKPAVEVVRKSEETPASPAPAVAVTEPSPPNAPAAPAQTAPTEKPPATTPPAPEPPAPPKPAKRELYGRITVGGSLLGKHLVIHNADSISWTGCMVFIREDGKYPAKYAAGAPIPAGGTQEIPLNRFHRDPTARMVAPNMVGITCNEGSVDLPARW